MWNARCWVFTSESRETSNKVCRAKRILIWHTRSQRETISPNLRNFRRKTNQRIDIIIVNKTRHLNGINNLLELFECDWCSIRESIKLVHKLFFEWLLEGTFLVFEFCHETVENIINVDIVDFSSIYVDSPNHLRCLVSPFVDISTGTSNLRDDSFCEFIMVFQSDIGNTFFRFQEIFFGRTKDWISMQEKFLSEGIIIWTLIITINRMWRLSQSVDHLVSILISSRINTIFIFHRFKRLDILDDNYFAVPCKHLCADLDVIIESEVDE